LGYWLVYLLLYLLRNEETSVPKHVGVDICLNWCIIKILMLGVTPHLRQQRHNSKFVIFQGKILNVL